MDLSKLIKSRSARMRHILNVVALCDDAITNDNEESAKINLTKLQVKEGELFLIAQQIEAEVDEQDLEAEVDLNQANSDVIIEAKVKVERFLSRAKKPPTTISAKNTTTSAITIKLPKLQIAKFDGAYTDWERFWDQYSAGIDKNPKLADVDKFNYLKGLLTEKAAITIQGISLTDANYAIAIGLLKEKYGKPEVLVAEHLRQLWNLRRVTRSESGQELRKLLEDFKMHLASLETLGKDVTAMGSMFCYMLLQALPTHIIREWNRQTQGKEDENLLKLLEFVKIEVEGIEQSWRTIRAREDSTIPKRSSYDSGKKESHSTASALFSAGTRTVEAGTRPSSRNFQHCAFCEDDQHYTSACTNYISNTARREALRRNKRCFLCLSNKHFRPACDRRVVCRICKQDTHHTVFCPTRREPESKPYAGQARPQLPPSSNVTASAVSTPSTSAETTESSKRTFVASAASSKVRGKLSVLQTIRIWIRYKGKSKQVTALIDGGSEKTFISQQVVQELKIPARQNETLTIHSFGGNKEKRQTQQVQLCLCDSIGTSLEVTAIVVPEICHGIKMWEAGQIERLLRTKGQYNWAQAMGPGSVETVDLLVGADWYWRIMTGHMKRLSSQLMATQSIFGWMLQGCIDTHSQTELISSMFVHTETQTETQIWKQELPTLWQLDKEGIMAAENESSLSLQDVEVLDTFRQTIQHINGRYQVAIPWAENKDSLGRNLKQAKTRLRKLKQKLSATPEIAQRYQAGIDEYLGNGHIEEVSWEEPVDQPIYYMPHQAIIKEDRKTSKLRIVFDASSHEPHQASLNDCHHIGPSLNPTIFDLLLRFRWYRIGISSDMEKAFLQILLREEDRDATRFLWTEGDWNSDTEPAVKVFRLTRVLFGMKSSPFLLAATIRHHIQTARVQHPEVCEMIDEQTYVDDMLAGGDTVPEARHRSNTATEIMATAGMKLVKWTTNSEELRQVWQQENKLKFETETEASKVLGLMWSPKEDRLSFKYKALLEAAQEVEVLTKRKLLEIVARVFDPLGFISPKVVILKCLLQDTWRTEAKWDEKLSDNILSIWETWKKDLQHIPKITVSRWLFTTVKNANCMTLHVFCDSSTRIYGATAYIVVSRENASPESNLIVSKSRLAPLQLISIPRLELLACLIGARLAKSIKEAWKLPALRTKLWSDSQVALQWIQNVPSKWKLFVGRRVQEIQTLTNIEDWSYCLTKENIADILTRGQSLEKLCQNKAWWKGPTWLTAENDWPNIPLPGKEGPVKTAIEVEEAKVLVTVVKLASLLNEEQFSTWNRLIRTTCWALRFISNCKHPESQQKGFLTTTELKQAENIWIKRIQELEFKEELTQLSLKKPLNKESPILQLTPYLDEDNLLRLGGRLEFSQLNQNQKHPILLRGGGHLTSLLIRKFHEQLLHAGVQLTLGKLREQFWILRGRQMVRKEIQACKICKKWVARPPVTEEAPLPAARLKETYPFQVSGVDFAGPIFLKQHKDTSKAYICLFTCAVTRAIHLELVSSLGEKPFLLALRRFVARRGKCYRIYSDNAKTFQAADRSLAEAFEIIEREEVQTAIAQSGIDWKFIPPRAAWWGGFYERMVGAVKRHLRRTLGNALLNAEEFATILTEVEAMVNARPLTTLTEDPQDTEYLSPAHFLINRPGGSLTEDLTGLTQAPAKSDLTKRWQYRKILMNRLWTQWRTEYLMQLRTAHIVKNPNAINNLQMDDVVLIMNEKASRGSWKKARIIELTKGRDGKVRSVLLRLPNQTTMRRAIQHICPLEVV